MKPAKRVRGPLRALMESRRQAVQALYQWQLTSATSAQLLEQFRSRPRHEPLDWDYFRSLVVGCVQRDVELRGLFLPFLDRPMEELDPVEYAILLIGVYELLYCPKVPWRVVINEAVEAARLFGNTDSTRYVNGVLDRAARAVRVIEEPPATKPDAPEHPANGTE